MLMIEHHYTLQQLAEHTGAQIVGDPACTIQRIATLENATQGDLVFLSNPVYRKFLATTQASAVILSAQDLELCKVNALVSDNVYLSFAQISHLFDKINTSVTGVHPTVVIGERCTIPSTVSIGANCVIGNNVVLGEDCVIGPGSVLEDNVTVGSGTKLFSRVSLYHDVSIGQQVVLHSGVIIGSDGFGYANDHGKWVKVSQLGAVSVGDQVEIGANTVVDRGAIGDTVIEQGVIIDNLVQIAHNVHIGAHTAIAGCVGIAGSATIGKYCAIGGAANINGHLTIVDQVQVTGMAMVTHSILKPGVYSSGTGLDTNSNWRKNAVRFRQLDKFARKVNTLNSVVKQQPLTQDE